MVLTQKYFDGRVPAQGELTDYDKETLKEFADVKAEVEKLLDVFKFRDAPATGCQPCHRFRSVPAVQFGKTPQNAEHEYFRMV